ncbi:acyl carrier protein [Corynebacterium ulceribovis]|uniref:acyl carrier protein n=1 Tax=Corynebacterium ulceribovis TaxID=487732 RepID=UPI00037FA679|nr:phosphopantetheine-binding protein [Corynebacterium ulceribovis]
MIEQQDQPEPTKSARQRIIDKLLEIVSTATGVDADKIATDADFDETLAIDSLSKVELAVRSEDAFGVRFDDEAIQQLRDLDDVATYIEEQTSDSTDTATK